MTRVIVVGGTHSGVGKTTLSTALMAAYRRRGLTVQAFKVGPDFIDPTYHTAATGRPGRNLDGWMLDRATVLDIFERASSDSDLAIVEGVMGLFDGASGTSDEGSTAEIAKWLGAPVLLVIDGAALARSAAAIVHGYETFDPSLGVVAVIANNLAGEAHYAYIQQAIKASSCKASIIGWLKRDPAVTIPDRHLGLFLAGEVASKKFLNRLADWVEQTVDLDLLLKLSTSKAASGTATIRAGSPRPGSDRQPLISGDRTAQKGRVRIGVARDSAFCFYYQDNLDLLEGLGAQLIFWSPINEALPSGLNGLYFGGGYPELFASALSDNCAARNEVRWFINRGGAVYAECGGLMYLTQAIVDTHGVEYPMTQVFPVKCRVQDRLAALGYVEVEGTHSNPIIGEGERIRGHQYRYSSIDPMPDSIVCGYESHSPSRPAAVREGYLVNNCLASYVHLHFMSNQGFAARWVQLCRTGVTT